MTTTNDSNPIKNDLQLLDLEQLYEQTVKMIFNLGLRLFKEEEEAKDFTQDVYMKAFSKMSQFKGHSKFSTWLYSLALNLGLNTLRRKKKIDRLDTNINMEQLIVSPEQDHLGRLSDQEESCAIREKLQNLPELYRLPIVLYYYEKMSYQKIAKYLKMKEGTVKSNIHRGKNMLRGLLREEVF